jgi:hypothetical protein
MQKPNYHQNQNNTKSYSYNVGWEVLFKWYSESAPIPVMNVTDIEINNILVGELV